MVGDEDSVHSMKSLAIRWLGHVERMNDEKMKKYY